MTERPRQPIAATIKRLRRSIAAFSIVALSAVAFVVGTMASADPAPSAIATPASWPTTRSPIALDPVVESKITAMIGKMTIEEKVGQVIQPEMKSITPEDVRTYHIGSIENGGGSVPNGNRRASVADWVTMIDAYYQASVDPKAHTIPIPMMWASDAVHGHNNVFGATLFPHNIGLGAARDPGLIKRIGAVTAKEVRSLGMDWSFAPTIAVARDDRWGRTYESYSEDPAIVVMYAKAMVAGVQGEGATFLNQDHVIATAKHFLGDGSTDGGRDQGNSSVSEAELIKIHGAGYKAALDAGLQSVMASFNDWHGTKMHANKSLLTGVLKERMGFDGMIMGDWNAHGQISGCTNGNCPEAFNAGLDIYNVPQDWKALHGNLVAQVKSGVIPMARLDDGVRRVLRVKFRARLFEQPSPAKRPNTYQPIGTPENRAVAREAVRKSLVLLKNNRGVLPLRATSRILVTGPGADNVGMQSGGWTLSWQGNDNKPEDFPGATSIYAGLKAALEASGGMVELSENASYKSRPDAAIVVFGEQPYAEFQGDQADVALHFGNAESLALLKSLKAKGIPTIAVMITGRPLYVNPQINASDAFVVAWLPGSEGAGIADVLVGDAAGKPRYDFQGRLSFSWPKRPDQTPLNIGDAEYDPQFAYGYGLSYTAGASMGALPLIKDRTNYGARGVFLADGKLWNGFKLYLGDPEVPRVTYVGSRTAIYGTESLVAAPDASLGSPAIRLTWNGRTNAFAEIAAESSSDIARESNGAMMLAITLRVSVMPEGPVQLKIGTAAQPIDADLRGMKTDQDQVLAIPLSCFEKGQDLAKTPNVLRIESNAKLGLIIRDVRLIETKPGANCRP